MLYQWVGMSFSSRTIFVRDASDALGAMDPLLITAISCGLPHHGLDVPWKLQHYRDLRNGVNRRQDARMTQPLTLPRPDGTLERYTPRPFTPFPAVSGPIRSRIGYAAVHVVADPLANINPTLDVALDW